MGASEDLKSSTSQAKENYIVMTGYKNRTAVEWASKLYVRDSREPLVIRFLENVSLRIQCWSHQTLDPYLDGNQSDQIGLLLKVHGNKFVAQIVDNYLGYFEKHHKSVKAIMASVWATLGNLLFQHLVIVMATPSLDLKPLDMY